MSITKQYIPEWQDANEDDEYSFFFESIGAQALEVYEVNGLGVPTFLSPNFYSVEFVGRRPLFDGGNIIITQHQIPDFTALKMVRNTPIYQTVDWKTFARFPSVMVEFALDRLTMILQELNNRLCDNDLYTPVTVIDQLITWEPYDPYYASRLNFALDKLTLIAQEIAAGKEVDPSLPFSPGVPP